MSTYLNIHHVTKITASSSKLSKGCSTLSLTFTDHNNHDFELTLFADDDRDYARLSRMAKLVNSVLFGHVEDEEVA